MHSYFVGRVGYTEFHNAFGTYLSYPFLLWNDKIISCSVQHIMIECLEDKQNKRYPFVFSFHDLPTYKGWNKCNSALLMIILIHQPRSKEWVENLQSLECTLWGKSCPNNCFLKSKHRIVLHMTSYQRAMFSHEWEWCTNYGMYGSWNCTCYNISSA